MKKQKIKRKNIFLNFLIAIIILALITFVGFPLVMYIAGKGFKESFNSLWFFILLYIFVILVVAFLVKFADALIESKKEKKFNKEIQNMQNMPQEQFQMQQQPMQPIMQQQPMQPIMQQQPMQPMQPMQPIMHQQPMQPMQQEPMQQQPMFPMQPMQQQPIFPMQSMQQPIQTKQEEEQKSETDSVENPFLAAIIGGLNQEEKTAEPIQNHIPEKTEEENKDN